MSGTGNRGRNRIPISYYVTVRKPEGLLDKLGFSSHLTEDTRWMAWLEYKQEVGWRQLGSY